MIWHIVRKDLRLLWPLAAVSAAVNLGNAALLCNGDTFARGMLPLSGASSSWVSNFALPLVSLIGLILLVVSVIHQDPFPGTTQDWLTRPIPRARLWAAKLLFIVVAALLPIFVGDVAMGIAEHLGLFDVLTASATRSLVLFAFVCAPAAMLSLVTRKLTDVLIISIGFVVALTVAVIVLGSLKIQSPVMESGYSWVVKWTMLGVLLGLFALVPPLQARWRSTHRVRWILLIAACLVPGIFFMPWGAALWAQRLTGNVGLGELQIQVSDAGRMTYRDDGDAAAALPPKSVWITVPVMLHGVRDNERIYVDHTVVRIISPTGQLMYHDSPGGMAARLAGHLLFERSVGNDYVAELTLQLPADVFAKARSEHATIRADLSLTALDRATEVALASLVSDPPDSHTRCTQSHNELTNRDYVSCVSTHEFGECFDIVAKAPGGGRQVAQCNSASYEPRALPLWRDPYYTTQYFAPPVQPDQERGRSESNISSRVPGVLATYAPAFHVQRSISFSLAAALVRSHDGIVQTVDGIGTAARFASPSAGVTDRKGNLFIVDNAESVVRKVTPSGEVSTFAGMPRQVGEVDGSGGSARFRQPRGIGIDASDMLFIADTGNGLIRKITPSGDVSTVMSVSTDDKAAASPARFHRPAAVVPATGGDLYVIELGDVVHSQYAAVVKRLSPKGVISQVAGPVEEMQGARAPGVVRDPEP